MKEACVTSQVFSRIGLLGNPSDGYQGKTISVSCANFWAEVHSPIREPQHWWLWLEVHGHVKQVKSVQGCSAHSRLLQVHLKAADTITFVPHPVHDLLEYSSLSQLTKQVTQQGYYGGIRLLMV